MEGGHGRRLTDEANVASQDVDELGELVQVPRLEDAAPRPGQIFHVTLEQPRMRLSAALSFECEGSQRAELEEVELAASGDSALAIEDRPLIAATHCPVDSDRHACYGEEWRKRRAGERSRYPCPRASSLRDTAPPIPSRPILGRAAITCADRVEHGSRRRGGSPAWGSRAVSPPVFAS